jgi:hypothetical protein
MKVIKFAIDVASGNRDFVIEQNYVKRNSKGLDGTPSIEREPNARKATASCAEHLFVENHKRLESLILLVTMGAPPRLLACRVGGNVGECDACRRAGR